MPQALEDDQHWDSTPRSRPSDRWPTVLGVVGMVAAGVGLTWFAMDRSAEGKGGEVASCRALLAGRECPVFALAWSSDGRRLAISGYGPTVRIWDRDSGSVRTIGGGENQSRFVIGWSENGRRLILGGLDVPVEAWDLGPTGPDGEQEVIRPSDRPEVLKMLAEGSRGGPIRVRGPVDRRSSWLPDTDSVAISAAFAPDGHSVVTAEADLSLRIWDAPSGRLRHVFRCDDWRGMGCVAFSPDGARVAAGGGGPIRVWDALSGQPLMTLGSASGGLAVLGFSPDGRRMAGANWDGTIRVWDLATRSEGARLGGHDGQVLSLAWSPDGQTLATGGYDSTVRLWDVAEPVALARAGP